MGLASFHELLAPLMDQASDVQSQHYFYGEEMRHLHDLARLHQLKEIYVKMQ